MTHSSDWVTDQMAEGSYGPSPQHVVHHYEAAPRKVSIKLDRNSRGYTWEVSYACDTLDEALTVIREANARLEAEYGG